MLDLGFLPDVERIVKRTPDSRQTMLFSATMPGDVVTLARRHMRQPTNIRAEGHDAPAPAPNTRQHVFRAHQMDKIEVLARVLQARDRGLTMVFCQTKRAADQVATALETRGFAVATVHGDLGQGQRERALRAFRSGKVDVLTATEVAARGLDVDASNARGERRMPGRRHDLCAPHRPDRSSRARRCRRHVRRLAGHAPLEAHQRRAEAGQARAGRDVFHLEHLYPAGHPARCHRHTPPRHAGPGGPGGRGGRGYRRNGQDPLAEVPPRAGLCGQGGQGRAGAGRAGAGRGSAGKGSDEGGAARAAGVAGGRWPGPRRAGQARKTAAEVGEGSGDAARTRRRRRTRAGRELAGEENQPAENRPQETRRKAS